MHHLRFGSVVGLFGLVILSLSGAVAAEDFYNGKTVKIIVGFSPGGGFDTYSRAIARHMAKHVPGNPTMIVVNKPGAGSLIAANTVYNTARPDGLTIGNFIGHLVLSQVLGRKGVEFDFRRFRWLGIPVAEHGACALMAARGITSLEQWQNATSPVKLGASGIGNVDYNTAVILKEVIGLPTQIVTGYRGTARTRLAAERGEIDGSCWQWESIKATWKDGLESKRVVIVLQLGSKPVPDLPDVPLARSIAKTQEARLLLKAGVRDPNLITISYALPPGTPEDRVHILRNAFSKTMKDPEFLAEAKRSNLDLDPVSGGEMQKLIDSYFTLDSALIHKMQALFIK